MAATMACVLSAAAATLDIETVITNPGEDASTMMNVSWSAYVPRTAVVYTRADDAQWSNATTLVPEQEHLCFTYDSISSKRPWGADFFETPIFFKCGAAIKGLAPDTEYKYKVMTLDGKESTAEHRFKTAGAQEWSCCIISDFHAYAPLPKRTRAAMDMMGVIERYDPSIDWVLHLGDVCAWGGSYSFWRDLYKEDYFHRFMWAGVNGNHDNMSRKYQLTNAYFRDANYVPRNGYEGEMGVCYHFRYGNAMFVMLNNEDMRDDAGFEAAAQWVRKVVTEARQSSNPPQYVFVCEHYQWFMGHTGKKSQYNRWSPIFDELGVDVALAGNNHIYVRSGVLCDGKETDGTRGTLYVQTPSADNERGMTVNEGAHNDMFKYRWTEGDRTVGALNMKVTPQGITITLHDRYGNLLDTSRR